MSRTPKIYVGKSDLVGIIAGQLYEQSPRNTPRNIEIIMNSVNKKLEEIFPFSLNSYSMCIEKENINTFIHDLLFNIPEFMELNLSQLELENNVKVDDSSRSRYVGHSLFDKKDKDSWKSDFIDLDAFVQNVVRKIFKNIQNNEDCFGCVFEKSDSLECITCVLNPYLKNNLTYRRFPKGKYTFSCLNDCYKSCQICCTECSEKDTCSHVCDSTPDVCGLTCHASKHEDDEF